MEKTKTVNVKLPLFPGFYNTIFEYEEEEYELEHINGCREEKGMEELEDCQDFKFDYRQYDIDVCKACTCIVERLLVGFIKTLKFDKIVRPNEYNFVNDIATADVVFEIKHLKKIKAYLDNHATEFAKAVEETFTDYPGFISFYSPNVGDESWRFSHAINKEVQCGFILDFICKNEGHNEHSLYDGITDYHDIHMEITNYDELIGENE